jgi:2-polyprenyl-6-methoxyphenol hydroxylase-like FAD-dependent oxidoreductase
MPISMGRQAVVIGAGLGGLTAACALSSHFDHVTILERDALPTQPESRKGTPQSRHPHALLLGGQKSLEELFPGFTAELETAGAQRARLGRDIFWERPGFDLFPVRDLGYDNLFMSRPLLEFVCRDRVEGSDRIEVLSRSRVEDIEVDTVRNAVTAVRFVDAEDRVSTLACDLVVDASGRGAPTMAALDRLGYPRPAETEIGVDISYSTAVFDVPADAPTEWKAVMHWPHAPSSSRGAFLFPIENSRWIVGLAGAHGDTPPGDVDGYMAFAGSLRSKRIYDAIRNARQVRDITRFNFPSSVRRRFEALSKFPRGLVPIADAVCRFNPAFGQGMSIAAQEACALRRVLERREPLADPLDGLAHAFFEEIQPLLATPWNVAENDFIYPQTRGERPPDMAVRLRYSAALFRLAAEDSAVHKTMAEVNSLLKPLTALREPQLAGRVMALMSAPS